MRRTPGFIAVALVLLASSSPVLARTVQDPPTVEVVHDAPLPCTVACAYWDAPSAAGYSECAQPFPQGSYDESTYRLTSHTGVVSIHTQPANDYDSFVCTDTEPRRLVQAMANACCYECQGLLGVGYVPWACEEQTALTYSGLAAANDGENDRFVLVSYNWSDTEPLPIQLWGPVELVDDSYEARLP